MAGIGHCGRVRKSFTHWLTPNTDESQYYVRIALLQTTCPDCDGFILEWYGISKKGYKTPNKRIRGKNHDEWIKRTKIDVDTTDEKPTGEGKAFWVKGSLPYFPWTMGRRKV